MSRSEDKNTGKHVPADSPWTEGEVASGDDRDLRDWMGSFLPEDSPSDEFKRSLKAKLADRRRQLSDPTISSSRSHSSTGSRSSTESPSSFATVPPRAHRSRWRRATWGVVAAAASVLAMVFWPSPVAYSFETMRSRLIEQAFVRTNVNGPGKSFVGWVSRVGDFAAVEAADSVAVAIRGQRMARYSRGDGVVKLVRTTNDRDHATPTRLLKVLCAVQENGANDLSISSQSWRRVPRNQNVDVELDVAFRDTENASDLIPVRFGIDSETGLPEWLKLLDDDGGDQASLSFGYPQTGPADLSAFGIPDHLADQASGNAMPGTDSSGLAGAAETDAPNAHDLASANPPAVRSPLPPNSEDDISKENDGDVSRIAKSTSVQAPAEETRRALSKSTRTWQSRIAVEVPTTVSMMSQQIDRQLNDVWRANELTPQPPADPYTLYRRLHLDLTGRIPRVTEIRESVHDEALAVDTVVESLLDSPDFDSNMAAVWTDWLLPPDVELEQFGGKPAFMSWLSDQFSRRVPYDEIVRQLLTAEGRVGDAGPVLFTTALEMKPEHLAKQTSRTFLGTRIDCAMCHDHPYDDWTQTDFWGYAALFARISRPQGKMNVMSSVLRVRDVGYGEVHLPDTEIVVAPKLLGGDRLLEQPESDQRRRALASWLTNPNNRQFARATVNLLWSHFFGAGLVEPRDDFGVHNPPLSPELLEQLAAFFVDSGFDVRSLVQSIVQSDTYAQSSLTKEERRTNESPRVGPTFQRPMFASMPIRWLNAGQLYDCLQVASGGFSQLAGRVQSIDRVQAGSGLMRIDNASRDQFVRQFGSPAGSVLEFQSGIPQALSLMNGSLANLSAGEETSRLLKGLQAPFFTDRDRIETVFLSLVSRPPRQEEWKAIEDMMKEDPQAPVPVILSDLVWALLNSAEFATNH